MKNGKRSIPHPRAAWVDPTTGVNLYFGALMRQMAAKRVVMLGETHDIAEIHRWQLHVAVALYTLRPNMMMAFEMFPRRLQPVLDEWVEGKLDTKTFIEKSEWAKVWGFPPEIYLPLFHFCRQNKIPMIAANCYRELVTRVGKEGWDAVPESERDGLTPSAPPTEGYRAYLDGFRRPGMPVTIDSDRFIRAQQTWDRAFACNMAKAIRAAEKGREPLIVGIIGRGHLEYGHGTPYQLADLGITDTAVLLTSDKEEIIIDPENKIADAVFRIDMPEPRIMRIPKSQENIVNNDKDQTKAA